MWYARAGEQCPTGGSPGPERHQESPWVATAAVGRTTRLVFWNRLGWQGAGPVRELPFQAHSSLHTLSGRSPHPGQRSGGEHCQALCNDSLGGAGRAFPKGLAASPQWWLFKG